MDVSDAHGFQLHDVSWAKVHTGPLGFEIDGSAGLVGPRADKLWEVRGAFLWASNGPSLLGKQ
eukprot:2168868-Karenia_brevis.AAC.1